ncbi:MAG: Tex-like N-terminal domain-containing protein, partial [Leuconostoc gelidum]
MTELVITELTQTDTAKQVSQVLNITFKQVNATLTLLGDGATIPFISRYRKEMTGELDEVQIRDIQSTAKKVHDLADRKHTVLKAVQEQQQLTPDLQKAIQSAETLQIVEDLYLPYKQKRRTKAMIARENGLQPLADFVLSHVTADIPSALYINDALPTPEDVLAGLHEILAEQIGENAIYRQWLRTRMGADGVLVSNIKRSGKEKDEQEVYGQYYD